MLWERASGRPLHRAIVWQDRRTADLLAGLRQAGYDAAVRERTGLLLDPYFSGSKIAWLLDHVPRARTRAEAGELAVGTVDAWLVSRLTAGALHVTDASNASRTLLFDIRRGEWDQTLLDLFRVPRELLPEVRSSSGVVGETDRALFGRPLPIAGIAGDQQAALFGQLCTRPGMVKNTYGTGCFMLMQTGRQAVASRNNLLTTVAWRLGTQPMDYALEGSVFVAGAAIQWLRDGLRVISAAPDVNALAASVPDSGGVFVVPAFAGLGAPYWDPRARGAIVGLTRGVTAAHIARATLEAIAYQVADVLHAMVADAGTPVAELRVDGGAAASDLLMQFQADILGVAVQRPTDHGDDGAGGRVPGGAGHRSLEEPRRSGRPSDDRSHVRADHDRGRTRGASGPVAPGRRARQGLGGVKGARSGQRGSRSSATSTTVSLLTSTRTRSPSRKIRVSDSTGTSTRTGVATPMSTSYT